MRADPAEQGEALQVVDPLEPQRIFVGAAGAPVEIRRVDDVDRHLAERQLAAPHADAQRAEHRPDFAHGALVQDGVEDRRHSWQQQAHVGADVDQGARQRPDDVGQPAGLDQGVDFGGNVQDFHEARVRRASMSRVTSVMPFSLRSKRAASASASSPITMPSGIVQPWSITLRCRRTPRPT